MIDHMEKIRGAMHVIEVAVAGHARDDVQWGLAWALAMSRINPRSVLRSCREIRFDGNESEKREAAIVNRMVASGLAYAKQVQEIEADVRNIYPADLAQSRLDNELGWEPVPGEKLERSLDRSCMIARARNPDTAAVRAKAHRIVRGRFEDLELATEVAYA